ncbi:FxsA family protein [Mycolicibacter kumamotonensis]|uniref:FxsA family protein n=1 Tax=Mycolicibacter kumamotonensis TaxID=354243 RepID=A0A7K3LFR5_9MYCO|nr:FxsA family protein [Mycolicibacter kumamotonensis]NDJ90456.1 FxsA family protein [Mycolicibacter kumamotonensis]
MASAVLRMFLVYVLAESAAVAALIWAIGFGWTTLLLLGAFVGGLVLSAGQLRRQIGRLRSGTGPAAFADGGLIAAGTLLVLVPGPLTTLVGLVLLAPPTRTAARPLLTAWAAAGLGRHTPLAAATVAGGRWYAARRAPGRRADYIDAEVVNVTDVTDVRPVPPPALSVG